MMDFNKNSLSESKSPYLRQHQDNPVHWQEWNKEVLEHAKSKGKLIFVSIGYSTCHWCHVMANEAFSDETIAAHLNKNFVCIKIDREQRPDLDHYFMTYVVQTQGQGGWPMNLILTPEMKPIFGGTYFPIRTSYGLPSFMEILQNVKGIYEQKKDDMESYVMASEDKIKIEEKQLFNVFKSHFDMKSGGFGPGQKFPPHNAMLFLMQYNEVLQNEELKLITEHTLNMMAKRGLQDHLQGGFFRYCVDSEWIIPHFEKMLYDQAMMLWVYSQGYHIFKKDYFKEVGLKIIKCLDETFGSDGLFYSAIDADTNHVEGATYTWATEELSSYLLSNEIEEFQRVYFLGKGGNFEGKHHLIKKEEEMISKVEDHLLSKRKQRKQPHVDKKLITSWNSLIGIGFLMAYRYLGYTEGLSRAEKIFEKLKEKHYNEGKLIHSSLAGENQQERFLEDYSSFLLFLTYLEEETGKYSEIIEKVKDEMLKYKQEDWVESLNTEVGKIKSPTYDHPLPSSVSMAEYALVRLKVLKKEDLTSMDYTTPLQKDFFNLIPLTLQGNIHQIQSPEKLSWDDLPLNVIQVKSDVKQDCFKQTCKSFNSVEDLKTK